MRVKRGKRTKKMLLVGGALATTSLLAIGCGPTVYANPKGCLYDDGGYDCNPPDASSDATDASNDAGGDATDAAIADAADGG